MSIAREHWPQINTDKTDLNIFRDSALAFLAAFLFGLIRVIRVHLRPISFDFLAPLYFWAAKHPLLVMPSFPFVIGEFYLTIFCSNCEERIPVNHPLGERSQIDGYYTLICQQCRHKGYYPPQSVERYQHQADGAARDAIYWRTKRQRTGDLRNENEHLSPTGGGRKPVTA